MGCVYAELYSNDLPRSYKDMIVDLHREILTPHTNILLERKYAYVQNGRTQSEEDAIKIDDMIEKWLRNTGKYKKVSDFEEINFFLND